jgi:hypothetical protein
MEWDIIYLQTNFKVRTEVDLKTSWWKKKNSSSWKLLEVTREYCVLMLQHCSYNIKDIGWLNVKQRVKT